MTQLWDAIIRSDSERIAMLEWYLKSREWKKGDPEPRRLERLIAAEYALRAAHIKAATDEGRPMQ